jgi:hypothetical protein
LRASVPLCLGDANGDGIVGPADVGLIKYCCDDTSLESLCPYDVACDATVTPGDVALTKL